MTDESISGTCRYVFDPDSREGKHDVSSQLTTDDLTDDGTWRCPHEPHEDRDLCLFHLPPGKKDDTEVKERLLGKIGEQGSQSKQFVGAKFGRLDLDHSVLESEDNELIDLRHTEFHGDLTLRSAIVRQPLLADGAVFHGDAYFTDASFESRAYFSKTSFRDRAYFIGAKFEDGAMFYNSTHDGDSDFSMAAFEDDVDFIESTFHRVHFRETRFGGKAEFKRAVFHFGMFWGATFYGDARFPEATFHTDVNFREAEFHRKVRLDDLRGGEDVRYVDLRRSFVSGGSISQPDQGAVIYDFEDAELGDVTLSGDRDTDELFERFRFLNTTFDGFDFGQYRDTLVAVDWTLHDVVQFEHPDGRDATQPGPGELESTYLKAKNGANEIGDAKAAAEFFRKEMTYRRYEYVNEFRDGTNRWSKRIVAIGQWIANASLDVASGYGERPSRVLALSVGIVVAFAGLFTLVGPERPYGTDVGYLLLSLESFVTLVLGGAQSVENVWIRLLAQLEGFVGSFLVALFVFTLTRSIHR